jgi:hypothetical protein
MNHTGDAEYIAPRAASTTLTAENTRTSRPTVALQLPSETLIDPQPLRTKRMRVSLTAERLLTAASPESQCTH